jgi:hypothetical protein
MGDRGVRVARAISAFVENPVTELVKGVLLLLIGLSEASRTLIDDLAHGRVRVGHGLIIIGFFGILRTLTHVLEGLEAGTRYMERREAGPSQRPETDAGAVQERGREQSREGR